MTGGPGDRRVLVVEDEAPLRHLLVAALRTLAGEVVAAGDVGAATDALGRAPVDLLVTDVRLADGRGTELVTRLRAAGDDLPVLLVTGDPHAVADVPNTAVLGKPFGLDDLRAAVAALTGWDAPGGPGRAPRP